MFPEYFPLLASELDEIWTDSIIVFDTNVLLRMYRFKEETVREITSLLDLLGDRVWIPHQVAWEYNRRRLDKIREAQKSYREIVDTFKNASVNIKKKLETTKDYGMHPNVDLERFVNEAVGFIDQKVDEIESAYVSQPASAYYESIHDRIGSIYDGKIGTEPTAEQINKFCEQGEIRYDAKLPPGFEDVESKKKANRPSQEVYGDYILWSQLIEQARTSAKSVIFVTEDAKRDWWLHEEGKTIGPLPALRLEFQKATSKKINFYRAESFLREAQLRFGDKVSTSSVDDVRKVSESIAVNSEAFIDEYPYVSIIDDDQIKERAVERYKKARNEQSQLEWNHRYTSIRRQKMRDELAIAQKTMVNAERAMQKAATKMNVLRTAPQSGMLDATHRTMIERSIAEYQEARMYHKLSTDNYVSLRRWVNGTIEQHSDRFGRSNSVGEGKKKELE